MTLPELLVCVTVMGLIMAVISAAIVVTLRQHASAEGRLNLAAAEQNVDVWLPTDLASASIVSTNPNDSPCGGPVCGGVDLATGTTALMLSWSTRVGENDDTSVVTTTVAYHFAPAADGTYALTRIECVGGSCRSHVVLRDLLVPVDPDTGVPFWTPGAPVPPEVIKVTNPLRFEDGAEMSDAENSKNARRVVVTINGGGTGGGSSGGSNEVSITAGGTSRGNLPARAAYQMPSLVQPKSRCGGPMVLIVDESQSLATAGVNAVRDGVVEFIRALDGTPVQLMIVPFNDRARSLGGDNNAKWHHYYEMSDPTEVAAAVSAAQSSITIGGGGGSGYTNWEDAWFRTFYNKDGSPPAVQPNTVVFFTDGVPNRDRASGGGFRHDNATIHALPPGNWGTTSGNNAHWGNVATNFSNAAFQRADMIAKDFRDAVRLIGVAVGPEIPRYNNLVSGTPAWKRHANSSGDRPWQTAGGSNLNFTQYTESTSATDREKSGGWTTGSSAIPPNNWASGDSTWYQLNGARTQNSQIVGKLVGSTSIEPFVTNAAGEFTNLKTGNLFTSPNWNELGPALQKIALGECGGTVNLQTRQGTDKGPNVSATFSYIKAGEYYDMAGLNPVPNALIGTTVSTNSVQKTVTIDMNMDDGLDRFIDLVPQGVSSLFGTHYKEWVCRSGPNAVESTLIDVVENGSTVPVWKGVRVKVRANQAVSCTLVVT